MSNGRTDMFPFHIVWIFFDPQCVGDIDLVPCLGGIQSLIVNVN